jgi:hypothetical protein
METLPPHSWLSPKVDIRDIGGKGLGIFAHAQIDIGEIVVRFGGTIISLADIRSGKANTHSYIAISEDTFVGVLKGQPEQGDEFINHSCDPNLWMVDEITLAARRPIHIDEEVTADYGMWEYDPLWQPTWRCACGTKDCRGQITGCDYVSADLNSKYFGHIAPFLKKRLHAMMLG